MIAITGHIGVNSKSLIYFLLVLFRENEEGSDAGYVKKTGRGAPGYEEERFWQGMIKTFSLLRN